MTRFIADERRDLENLLFDLMSQYHLSYRELLTLDMMMLHRFVEHLNEKASGKSRLKDAHKAMIEEAKREREEWKRTGFNPMG